MKYSTLKFLMLHSFLNMVTLAHVTHYVLFCYTVYAWTYVLRNIRKMIIATYLSRFFIGYGTMGKSWRPIIHEKH